MPGNYTFLSDLSMNSSKKPNHSPSMSTELPDRMPPQLTSHPQVLRDSPSGVPSLYGNANRQQQRLPVAPRHHPPVIPPPQAMQPYNTGKPHNSHDDHERMKYHVEMLRKKLSAAHQYMQTMLVEHNEKHSKYKIFIIVLLVLFILVTGLCFAQSCKKIYF